MLLLASCSSPTPSTTTPTAGKLAATQPQCDFVNYHRDESVNVQGPGKCTTDCDCDGTRSCTRKPDKRLGPGSCEHARQRQSK